MGSNITVTIIVIAYLLFVLWIGWYSSTKISASTNFMVAGRRPGPFFMASTLAIAEIGGGSSLGAVQNGMSGSGPSASRYIITMGIAFIILNFMAPKFRAATVKTVPEYFRRRYGKSCGIMTATIMSPPLVGFTVGQLIASAAILSTVLNIDYQVAVTTVAAVVMVYSTMDGLRGVTLTDSVQIFLIVVGMTIAVPSVMDHAGGWDNAVPNIPEDALGLFQDYSLFGIISLVIMYTVTSSVGQETALRFYAAGDEKAIKDGTWPAALVDSTYAFTLIVPGIIMLVLVNIDKLSFAQFESVGTRYVLPILVIDAMPVLICGLPFAGIISATMSSSGSDPPGTDSTLVNSIYKAVLKPDTSSQSIVKVIRIVVCPVGLASMLIALFDIQGIVSALMFYFTLRTADFFFPYIMEHYWKKVPTAGTTASLTAGTIVVVYLERISRGIPSGIKFSQPVILGLTAASICFIIFSLAMPSEKKTTELVPRKDD